MNAMEFEAGIRQRDPSIVDRVKGASRMLLATILLGIGSGVIGIAVAVLIRQVQVISFGDAHGGFLEIALQAPPWRRIACLMIGGFVGAGGWFYLRGTYPGIITTEEALGGAQMPPLVTLLNCALQDIVVALGGSFGREAAPREAAAMWGTVIGDTLGVTSAERKVLVACGCGAGLAAVYSVPISGALYTVEHVMQWDTSFCVVLPAIISSWIAVVVASVVVDDAGLYEMRRFSYQWPSLQMLLWACMIGPLVGVGAVAFKRTVKFFESFKPVPRFQISFQTVQPGEDVQVQIEKDGEWVLHDCTVLSRSAEVVKLQLHASNAELEFDQAGWELLKPAGRRNWTILVAMPTVFLILGVLAHSFPTLLGNGRALATVAIRRQRSVQFFVALLLLKALLTAASIGSGAAGGTLTPSVALGATIGAVTGETWQFMCPALAPHFDQPMSIVAAGAFLAIVMQSPVTSLWLLVEFSGQGVARSDLLLLLNGDLSGIFESKCAIGMLLPMSIAILLATLTVKHGSKFLEPISRAAHDLFSTSGARTTTGHMPLPIVSIIEPSAPAPPSPRLQGTLFRDDSSEKLTLVKMRRLIRSKSEDGELPLLRKGSMIRVKSSDETDLLAAISHSSNKREISSFRHPVLLQRYTCTDLDVREESIVEEIRHAQEEVASYNLAYSEALVDVDQADLGSGVAEVDSLEPKVDDVQLVDVLHRELVEPSSVFDGVDKDLCFECFTTALLFDMCLTVSTAAAHPDVTCAEKTMDVAAFGTSVGVGVAFVRAIGSLLRFHSDTTYCLLSLSQRSHSLPFRGPGILDWHQKLVSIGAAMFFAFLGATVPLLPWLLRVWRDPGGGVTALCASMALAVAMAACGASVQVRAVQQSTSPALVIKYTMITALAACLACAIGIAMRHFGLVPGQCLANVPSTALQLAPGGAMQLTPV